MKNEELIKLAIEARENAYAPYSHWKVGAALLTAGGKVYKGCNIENSAFTSTSCAERTAFFSAIALGEKNFDKIAVVGGDEKEGIVGICTPCGVCRQVMSEFCDPDKFKVICAISPNNYKEYTLRELIPDVNFILSDGHGYKG